jgi:Uma2 family endonuclease
MATAERSTGTSAEETVPHDTRTEPARRRFNVSEYYRMAEVGILRRRERVELIDGDILVMCPIGNRHAGCVIRLTNLLAVTLAGRALVSAQNPFSIDDHNEPEPDLAVLTPRPDCYTSAHPSPEEILWLIEVMDTSAAYDRGKKLGLYARAGVREVWLVDLNRQVVEAYRRPVGEVYTESRVHARGQSFAPEVFPDVALGVDAILG